MSCKKGVLHITTHLGGGVGKVVLNYLKQTKKESHFTHSIASLDYINKNSKLVLEDLKISYKENLHFNIQELLELVSLFDIVVIHWWNHPLMYQFLVKQNLPKSRVIMWSHISGLHPPSNFTAPLFEYADRFLFTTPISYKVKIVQELSKSYKEKLGFIWSTGGFEEIKDSKKKHHSEFNIGYIGTVDYSKIYRNFLELFESIDIDDVNFLICGGSADKEIEKEAKQKGIEKRFHFFGKVDDVQNYLAIFDIFAYPLSQHHFGTCDQALAEAMAAGIVPVVFDNPMESYMVENGVTGIVVKDEQTYKNAIKKLYKDDRLRKRLSINAKKAAQEKFSLNVMVNRWEQEFEDILKVKKTQKKWRSQHPWVEITPFEVFIESVGEFGELFLDIFNAPTEKEKHSAIQSIKKIFETTNSWESKTKGTLKHYNSVFKNKKLKYLDMILNN